MKYIYTHIRVYAFIQIEFIWIHNQDLCLKKKKIYTGHYIKLNDLQLYDYIVMVFFRQKISWENKMKFVKMGGKDRVRRKKYKRNSSKNIKMR